MDNTTALEVRDLRKHYGSTKAVDGLNLSARRGEIFGLPGPNGAGKTTTLECVEGLRTPDGGEISVCGINPATHPRELWNTIGVQLQASALPDSMTPREALDIFSRYHGTRPRPEILERMGLSAKLGDRYENLSTGQKRRLSLSLAVAHSPRVVFLDEPTAGLDVESRTELHSLMGELRNQGATIILATHDMAEAEKLCDTIAIVIAGQAVVSGTPARITAAGDGRTRISVSTRKGEVARNRPALPEAELVSVKDGYCLYQSENPAVALSSLLSFLSDHGNDLEDLRVERPSLEERLMEITNNGRNM